jgi:hypothetical protein
MSLGMNLFSKLVIKKRIAINLGMNDLRDGDISPFLKNQVFKDITWCRDVCYLLGSCLLSDGPRKVIRM